MTTTIAANACNRCNLVTEGSQHPGRCRLCGCPEHRSLLRCEICERLEGSTLDRWGEEDGIPLGEVSACDRCGRLACPDCAAEFDCCFVHEDDHDQDPSWAPPGWKRVSATAWQRVP